MLSLYIIQNTDLTKAVFFLVIFYHARVQTCMLNVGTFSPTILSSYLRLVVLVVVVVVVLFGFVFVVVTEAGNQKIQSWSDAIDHYTREMVVSPTKDIVRSAN
jgi:hypothetical protein